MNQQHFEGKPRPPDFPLPLWYRAWLWLRWPYDAHQLRKAGFQRLGWKHWEVP